MAPNLLEKENSSVFLNSNLLLLENWSISVFPLKYVSSRIWPAVSWTLKSRLIYGLSGPQTASPPYFAGERFCRWRDDGSAIMAARWANVLGWRGIPTPRPVHRSTAVPSLLSMAKRMSSGCRWRSVIIICNAMVEAVNSNIWTK